MDGRIRWISIATLAVAGVTLAVAVAIALRPAASANPPDGRDVRALQAEIEGLRDDVAALRSSVEQPSPAASVDLSSIESRLAGIEGSVAALGQAVEVMNATARTICDMVADSPFTPANQC